MKELLVTFVLQFLLLVTVECRDRYLPDFHFVPSPLDWMNDPNGPFYDVKTDTYHLLFQYQTPRVWAHAMSKDLFHWQMLPIAIGNDESYNKGGVYSGSTTIIDNTPFLLYSVSTNDKICIAYPTDMINDPNLVNWTNADNNCPLDSTRDTNTPFGRDPTTAWQLSNGDNKWYFVYGIEYQSNDNIGGAAQLVAVSNDWKTFTAKGYLFSSDVSGEWECPDFFPLPSSPSTYVMKASIRGYDRWLVGSYDESKNEFIPNSNAADINSDTVKQDFGRFYASKSFLDSKNNRQLLWGWINEERPAVESPQFGNTPYGWAGIQTLPREIKLASNGYSLVTPIIAEFDDLLHIENSYFEANKIVVSSSDGVKYFSESEISGIALDIQLEVSLASPQPSIKCGIVVMSNGNNAEYTPIGINFDTTSFHVDTTHSSINDNCTRADVNAPIPDWSGIDSIKLRVIVDHSVVEAYVNNGAAVITRRMYPTLVESVKVGLYASATDDTNQCVFNTVRSWNIATTYEEISVDSTPSQTPDKKCDHPSQESADSAVSNRDEKKTDSLTLDLMGANVLDPVYTVVTLAFIAVCAFIIVIIVSRPSGVE